MGRRYGRRTFGAKKTQTFAHFPRGGRNTWGPLGGATWAPATPPKLPCMLVDYLKLSSECSKRTMSKPNVAVPSSVFDWEEEAAPIPSKGASTKLPKTARVNGQLPVPREETEESSEGELEEEEESEEEQDYGSDSEEEEDGELSDGLQSVAGEEDSEEDFEQLSFYQDKFSAYIQGLVEETFPSILDDQYQGKENSPEGRTKVVDDLLAYIQLYLDQNWVYNNTE